MFVSVLLLQVCLNYLVLVIMPREKKESHTRRVNRHFLSRRNLFSSTQRNNETPQLPSENPTQNLLPSTNPLTTTSQPQNQTHTENDSLLQQISNLNPFSSTTAFLQYLNHPDRRPQPYPRFTTITQNSGKTSSFVRSMFRTPSPTLSNKSEISVSMLNSPTSPEIYPEWEEDVDSSKWNISFFIPSQGSEISANDLVEQEWLPLPVPEERKKSKPFIFREWAKASTHAVTKFEERNNAHVINDCRLQNLWHCFQTFQNLELRRFCNGESENKQWLYAREMLNYYPPKNAPYKEVKFWYKVAKQRDDYYTMVPQYYKEDIIGDLVKRKRFFEIPSWTPQGDDETRNGRNEFENVEYHTIRLKNITTNRSVGYSSRIVTEKVHTKSEYVQVRNWYRNLQCRKKMEGKCPKTLDWNKECVKQVVLSHNVFIHHQVANQSDFLSGHSCVFDAGCGEKFLYGNKVKTLGCNRHYAHYICFLEMFEKPYENGHPFMVQCPACRANSGIKIDAPITAKGWNRLAHGVKYFAPPAANNDFDQDQSGFYYATWDMVEQEASQHIWRFGNLKKAYPSEDANRAFSQNKYMREITDDSDFEKPSFYND